MSTIYALSEATCSDRLDSSSNTKECQELM